MPVKQIITGHINEVLNREDQLAKERMAICNECPLKRMKVYGWVCDSSTYLNVETGEISKVKKPGFKNGCACRLEAKVRVKESECPLEKWHAQT